MKLDLRAQYIITLFSCICNAAHPKTEDFRQDFHLGFSREMLRKDNPKMEPNGGKQLIDVVVGIVFENINLTSGEISIVDCHRFKQRRTTSIRIDKTSDESDPTFLNF